MNMGVTLSIRGTGDPVQVHIDRAAVVGRASTSDVWLPFDFVSARHLRVFPENEVWYVEDLGSTNGTSSPNGPVLPHTPLKIGPKLELMIQNLELEFSQSAPPPAAFTLALSGSMARQLAADVAGPSGYAFIEVMTGPAMGARIELQDALQRVGLLVSGSSLEFSDDSDHVVIRDGEGFGLQIGEAEARRLRSGERFKMQGTTLSFFDPLEAQLSPIPEPEPEVSESAPPKDTSEQPDKKIPLAALLVLAAVVGVAVLILSLFLV
jgi:hypothetical protein